MNNDRALLTALSREPWAMMPAALTELVTAASSGTADTLAYTAGPDRQRTRSAGAGLLAVLPICGVLMHRSTWLGSSTAALRSTVAELAADPKIAGILLDVDSPGGSTYGTAELADAVFAARRRKPVWACCNTLCASAAYWTSAAAHRVLASPSADVGSIGVWAAHLDLSKNLETAGIKVTLISAGKHKVEGNPYQALDDEARRHFQESVDESYSQFVRSVARGRGVAPVLVRTGFGEGRLLHARAAAAAGLVDGIATFEETAKMMLDEIAQNTATRPAQAVMTPEVRERLDRRHRELAALEREVTL